MDRGHSRSLQRHFAFDAPSPRALEQAMIGNEKHRLPSAAPEFYAAPMSGDEIRSLMRRSHVTIRELAKRIGITMKRIRDVRATGLGDANAIRDWVEAITGKDPGHVQARPVDRLSKKRRWMVIA